MQGAGTRRHGVGFRDGRRRGSAHWSWNPWIGWALVFSLFVASCKAIHNEDGSWEFEFAPDMTITAMGLCSAIDQMGDLWENCLAGTWDRPCSPEEIHDIKDTLDKLAELKAKGSGARGLLKTAPVR
jgi:hypothetical protein